MGTIAEKLTYLNNTKSDIRDAIIAKGVDVPSDTTFREYATKIEDINDATTTLEFVERVNENGGTVTNLNKVLNELNNVTDESLLMIPSGRKEGVLYSQIPVDGSGDFTVNRNSPVWIENSEGVLVEVPANVPVFDKNGNLVVQEQSTNYIPYSDDFEIWNGSGVTKLTDTILAPNNIDIVHKLNFNEGVKYIDSLIMSAGEWYTSSIWLKSDEECTIGIRNGGSGDGRSNKSINVTTYWQRYEASSIAIANADYRFLIENRDVNLYDTNVNIYMWRAQGEKKEYASSPIYTNGAAETRLADEITVTPPVGTTEITETVNGVENTITTIPVTYQISEGLISKIVMK